MIVRLIKPRDKDDAPFVGRCYAVLFTSTSHDTPTAVTVATDDGFDILPIDCIAFVSVDEILTTLNRVEKTRQARQSNGLKVAQNREHMRSIARLGGLKVSQDREHMRQMARRANEVRWGKRERSAA